MNAKTKAEIRALQAANPDVVYDEEGEVVPVSNQVRILFPGVPDQIGKPVELGQGITMLIARRDSLEEETAVSKSFDAYPWDGAYALDRVMTRMFGWTQGKPVYSFWGKTPPQLRQVQVGIDKSVSVPWGRIAIANTDGGYMDLGASTGRDGTIKFSLKATVKRRDETLVTEIFAAVRQELIESSIYRGKAIKIRFTDDKGKVIELPEPEFMDPEKVRPEQLILSDDVAAMVTTNLMTPIRRMADLLRNNIPVKRSVLLTGVFGVGKSLIASVASHYAVTSGVTFVYVDKAADLARAVAFCKQYQTADSGAVIFCEDVDRVTAGARDATMDELFNIIDGIDSKRWNIITVLTTNDIDSIHGAMIRPGRAGDAIIEITTPDAKAVEKLLRHYGGSAIAPSTPLEKVGHLLAGNIPAVIEEAVKRAKLAQLTYQEPGTLIEQIGEPALIVAANTMRAQIAVQEKAAKKPEPTPPLDMAFSHLMHRVMADGAPATTHDDNDD